MLPSELREHYAGTCGRSKHLRFYLFFLDLVGCRRWLLSWCRLDEAKFSLNLSRLKASNPSGQQTVSVSAFCWGAPKIPPRLCVPAWGFFSPYTHSRAAFPPPLFSAVGYWHASRYKVQHSRACRWAENLFEWVKKMGSTTIYWQKFTIANAITLTSDGVIFIRPILLNHQHDFIIANWNFSASDWCHRFMFFNYYCKRQKSQMPLNYFWIVLNGYFDVSFTF